MKSATWTIALPVLALTLAACGGGGSEPAKTLVVSTFSDYSGSGSGMAFDSAGNLYVADYGEGRIIQITPAGVSSVFSDDALLGAPSGIAIDGSDNLYVCNDQPRHDIIKITQAGDHSLFAGTTGSAGSSNTAPVTFDRPYGLAIDRARQLLYVADADNSKVRRVDLADGTVSDFATLDYVYSVAVDGDGYVYASSGTSDHFAKYTPTGTYDNGYTLSGLPETSELYAVAADSAGNMLVADYANHVVWKIDTGGHGHVLAGLPGTAGLVNGPAESAQFSMPREVAVDALDRVYVTEQASGVIRRIALE
jgi:tripartite motif-containing protein 71